MAMAERTLEQRLEAAELELADFEHQPPLGWRAYQRGRNERMGIIIALKQHLEHG